MSSFKSPKTERQMLDNKMKVLKRKRMKEETEWIKNLLPDHYTCEPRENGVHCYSEIGINDDHNIGDDYNPKYDNHFELIVQAIKQKFGKRFMEIFHQTCTYHKKFTVYIRPI